jgi:PTH1 family peptidyl-tRNA hydrolase
MLSGPGTPVDGLDLKLIVGLGNPGPEHADTRHNAGCWFVDQLARRYAGTLRPHARYHGEVGRIEVERRELWLLKPQTYMNRSGMAVGALTAYLRIAAPAVLVAHDELDLDAGIVRLKTGGGAGGHNGLKDVISHIGEDFWRMRFGIGHPGDRHEVIDYVLRSPPTAEFTLIGQAIEAAVDMLPRMLSEGADVVMNRLHRRGPTETDR